MNENENWREILSRMEQKIDKLETQVENINHRVNPPWWKNFAGFLVNNFFTILTFVSLILIAWKAWEFYLDISNQLESVKESANSIKNLPSSAGDSIKNAIKGLGF
jgi:archaellum component FlaC